MPKPLPHRLDPATYPVSMTAQTRFQDMDINGHLNNVAFAALFENARVQLNRNVRPWADRPANQPTMVAAVEINYLREGNYPERRMHRDMRHGRCVPHRQSGQASARRDS